MGRGKQEEVDNLLELFVAAGAPTKNRNVSSVALRTPGQTLIVDAGEGTCRQAAQAGIPGESISDIFITHLHGDHCFGLPGLLEYASNARHGQMIKVLHLHRQIGGTKPKSLGLPTAALITGIC